MIPKDIKQVVERLITRGSIKRPGWTGAGDKEGKEQVGGKKCRLCGKFIGLGKTHDCPKAILLALLLLLPFSMFGQSKVTVPVVFLDARVTFVQPDGKEAKVYMRKKSSDSWKLWQTIPKNPIAGEQIVVLALPQPVVGTTQCQVVFQ